MAVNSTEEIKEVEKKEQQVINFDEFTDPLKHTWTFWFYKPDRSKTYEESQQKVASFNTIKDFCSLYNDMQPASKIRQGHDCSVFKRGILPSWKHDANKDGGRWLMHVRKKQRNVDLDNFWQKTLLCVIGDAFGQYSDNVYGAIVNVRPKGDKVSVWTNTNSEDIVMAIGRKWKERLNMPSNNIIVYQTHIDAMSRNRNSATVFTI